MLSQPQMAAPFPADVMAAAAYSLMHEPWLYAPGYAPAHMTPAPMPQQWAHSWSPPPIQKKLPHGYPASQPLQHQKGPGFVPVEQNGFSPTGPPMGFVDLPQNANGWSPRMQHLTSPSAEPRVEKMKKKHEDGEKKRTSIEDELSKQSLYKTELCRSFSETGVCRYGHKCQFAHGHHELRPVLRHPKYKTETCKTFTTTGICPYGPRCRFIHPPVPAFGSSPPTSPPASTGSPPSAPGSGPVAASSPPANSDNNGGGGVSATPLPAPVVWSNSWPGTTTAGPTVLDQASSPPPTHGGAAPLDGDPISTGPVSGSVTVAEIITSGSKVTRAVQTQTPDGNADTDGDDDELHDEVKRLAIFETIAKNV